MSVCSENHPHITANSLYTTSQVCKTHGHVIKTNSQMITMDGIYEEAGNFIYAIKSYTLRKFVDAKIYAKSAILVASAYEDSLNCFVINLSTLLLIILNDFALEETIKNLLK